jgi:ribonuclease D
MVTTSAELDSLCEEISGAPYYALDTEFHTERTYYPKLALIQLGWADRVALVDPLAVDPQPLARLFQGPGIAVAHAAEQDIDVLDTACGAVPATVFDTQIVAGFLVAVPTDRSDAGADHPQGRPAVGLAHPAHVGASTHLRRR